MRFTLKLETGKHTRPAKPEAVIEVEGPPEAAPSADLAASWAVVTDAFTKAKEFGIPDEDRDRRLNFAGGALVAYARAAGRDPAEVRAELTTAPPQAAPAVPSPYAAAGLTVAAAPPPPQVRPHPGAQRPVPIVVEVPEDEQAEPPGPVET
jgi:hypothetical protein